jgi:hypothetical protein
LFIFLGPLLTISVTIIGNSVPHPSKYVVPATVFVILVVTAGAVLGEDLLAPIVHHRERRRARTRESAAHVLYGCRERRGWRTVWMGIWLVLGAPPR